MHKLLFICVGILIGFASFSKFTTTHSTIPKGCDEFGYLHFSAAINQGTAFQNHTPRPYLVPLIDTLQKAGFSFRDYNWLITPHAYHLNESQEKTINQYAPGTPYLLALFPTNLKGIGFSVISILLVFISLFLIIPAPFYTRLATCTFFTLLVYLLPPFLNELHWVNSVAPTFGLLLLAGAMVYRKPVASVFFIALSANFRQVNLLMLVPFALFFIYTLRKDQKAAFQFSIQSSFALIMGIMPYLIYAFVQFGSPFVLSYSALDTQWVTGNEIWENLRFYFHPSNAWFMATLLGLTSLAILYKTKHIPLINVLYICTFVGINYVFFVLHKIHLNYYTYAATVLLWGCVISHIPYAQLSVKYGKYLLFTCCILFMADGIGRLNTTFVEDYEDSKTPYLGLCDYDIIWANEYSGSTEMVCKNNGFVYHAGTKKTRQFVMQYLHAQGYSQAILVNDIWAKRPKLMSLLKEAKLPHHSIADPHMGEIIVIP